MNSEHEHEIRIAQCSFIGKIIAGFTHEVKNYLAIIKESSGLIEDMITFRKSTESGSEQYLEMTRSIEEQVEKTNNLCRHLNRFAHRMDAECSSYSINDSLDELFGLLSRFANQKKITLKKDFGEDIPAIYGNPSLLQFVIFSFINDGFLKLDRGGTISLRTAAAIDSVQLQILLEGNFTEHEGNVSAIPPDIAGCIIKQLKGTVKQEGGRETLIKLPLTSP